MSLPRGYPTVGDVFRMNFAAAVEQLHTLESKLRDDHDSEDLHDARVAVRRMRSYLRTFLPVLDAPWANELRVRLAWLNRHFAEARDLDVLVETIERRGAAFPAGGADPAPAALERLLSEREARHDAVRAALHDERYGVLVHDLATAALHPRVSAGAHVPGRRGARRVLGAVWKRARKRVRKAGRRPTEADLHRIRIAAKHVRYAAECFAPLHGKRAAALARHAERLQTVLGERHDAVMIAQRLQSFGIAQDVVVAPKPARWRPVWRRMRADYRRLR